ncbi:LLM class flavin-dependent oxidoreductase [Niallia nealsonii]|uniref:LLM class flavin-dependent oxidoreductase n=1 Tax=Niallia nealsonii TaxID=115979 RepID=A0A2N0Z207_9BACI|nr:LLM class flavin-dependent oxidoreductase [Niallia nealsonii]PKG23540.1 LLM class flavin-dependent oxidoreductase [Niallia nealsonii]
MKLSVLDQSVISNGSTARTTLQNTVKLAQLAEEMGFTRFWVAEHHNSNGMAGSSPEVLLAHIASHTKTIKVGSGGVLLPQYSPYKVAENFKVLEALFPNRIDLGIGRSPGGSLETRLALTDGIRKSMNEFPRQLQNLQRYLHNNKETEQVIAYPISESIPKIWVLGITHRGARLAAENGLAFTYGHFISPVNGKRALQHYYENFAPSSAQKKPTANVCIFVVCASTQEKAEQLAFSQDLWLLSVSKGKDTKIPSYLEAKQQILTNEDKRFIKENRKRMIIGTKEKVREELLRLQEQYQTEEFMILCNLYHFEDKVNSYSLMAESFL